jgi:ribosomal protein S18 acetylase RimI-like enzyme
LASAIDLRPGTSEDYQFALELYLEAMRPYTEELMVWDETKQRRSFSQQWKTPNVTVITLRREAAGWLQVAESPAEIWLYQFFVSPEHQRRGIGTAVLHRLLAEWSKRPTSVRLTVLKNNPARRLYERCGFEVVAEIGIKFEMRLWLPRRAGFDDV